MKLNSFERSQRLGLGVENTCLPRRPSPLACPERSDGVGVRQRVSYRCMHVLVASSLIPYLCFAMLVATQHSFSWDMLQKAVYDYF